jgi:hypothetical protein
MIQFIHANGSAFADRPLRTFEVALTLRELCGLNAQGSTSVADFARGNGAGPLSAFSQRAKKV